MFVFTFDIPNKSFCSVSNVTPNKSDLGFIWNKRLGWSSIGGTWLSCSLFYVVWRGFLVGWEGPWRIASTDTLHTSSPEPLGLFALSPCCLLWGGTPTRHPGLRCHSRSQSSLYQRFPPPYYFVYLWASFLGVGPTDEPFYLQPETLQRRRTAPSAGTTASTTTTTLYTYLL